MKPIVADAGPLIRLFIQGENGAHRWELFNLRDDEGEKTDLAASQAERVTQMDAVIESFLAATKAVQPVRNPAFNETAYHPEREGVQVKAKAAKKAKAAATGVK